jgi:hypothetical protein
MYKFSWEFGVNTEWLIVSYYLIFILSLRSSSCKMHAIGLTLCILSRYTLILWIPFFLYYYYTQFGANQWVKLVCWTGLLCLVLFGPFVFYDGGKSFIAGLAYYNTSALGIWNGAENTASLPVQLQSGYSFTSIFYSLTFPNINLGFQISHYSNIVLGLGLCVLYFVLLRTEKIQDNYLFLTASLKLSIYTVYCFFPAPFSYLFYLPLALNLVVMARILGNHYRLKDNLPFQ